MIHGNLLRASLPFLLLTVAAAQRRVWVVDLAGGPGVQFTQVAPAVAAAADGDRIEVRGPGPYAPFFVNKGLDIEAVANASLPSIEVRAIPAGRSARIAGFRLSFDPSLRTPSLWIHDCAGPVTVASVQASSTGPGLLAEHSASILVVDSVLTGAGHVSEYSIFAAPGLVASAAAVVVQRSTVQGGQGQSFSPIWPASPGMPGCQTDSSSSLVLVACTVRGGNGGHGGRLSMTFCVPGQDGGAGLVAQGRCVVMERSQISGGTGGTDRGGCGAGAAGRSVIGSFGNPAALGPDTVLSGGAA